MYIDFLCSFPFVSMEIRSIGNYHWIFIKTNANGFRRNGICLVFRGETVDHWSIRRSQQQPHFIQWTHLNAYQINQIVCISWVCSLLSDFWLIAQHFSLIVVPSEVKHWTARAFPQKNNRNERTKKAATAYQHLEPPANSMYSVKIKYSKHLFMSIN